MSHVCTQSFSRQGEVYIFMVSIKKEAMSWIGVSEGGAIWLC